MYGKCLETRSRRGLRWRRYRTSEGTIVTTYELPCAVLDGVAPASRVAGRLAAWHRGQARHKQRAAILQALAAGTKPLAIAHALNVSVRWVERLRIKNEKT